jgi:uncharacterized membrane protein
MEADPRHTPGGRRLAVLALAVLALVALAAVACGDGPTSAPGLGEPDHLRLSMHAVRLSVGEDTTITATFHDRYGYEVPTARGIPPVSWSTSNPDVATVSDGVVRGIGEGEATVAAAAGSLAPASLAVQVLAPHGPVMDGYQAIALGRLGGTQSNAWAINNEGVVAGWSNVSPGRAFRWTETDGMTELQGTSSSRGINGAGDIVGFFYHENGFSAYVHRDGARTELQALETGSNSQAFRINDAGTVVGKSDPQAHAVVWTRGEAGAYGAPVVLGYRNVNDGPVVNDRGDIAFTAFNASSSGLYEPVLWQVQPDGSYGDALHLGRPEGGSYFVRDINDAGLVVGFRWTGAVEMAVLWHPDDYSAPVDLGVGQAWGINSHNQIVGVTGGELPAFGGLPRRPALWELTGNGEIYGPFDFGTPPGFEYGGARAINDSGWIAGSAWGPGEVMATLWRPDL